MAYAYAVEYLRNGKPDRFITLDKTAADDYAVRWDGIIYDLEKICQSDNSNVSEHLCMTKEAACCPAPQTVM